MLVIIYNNLYIFNYIYIIKNSPQSGARVLGRAGGDGRRGDAPGGVERAPGRPGPQGGQLFLFSILKKLSKLKKKCIKTQKNCIKTRNFLVLMLFFF